MYKLQKKISWRKWKTVVMNDDPDEFMHEKLELEKEGWETRIRKVSDSLR